MALPPWLRWRWADLETWPNGKAPALKPGDLERGEGSIPSVSVWMVGRLVNACVWKAHGSESAGKVRFLHHPFFLEDWPSGKAPASKAVDIRKGKQVRFLCLPCGMLRER